MNTAQQPKNGLKNRMSSVKNNRPLFFGLIALTLLIAAAIGIFLVASSGTVKIDTSRVIAPSIDLAAHGAGVLEAVYVSEGDVVGANTLVARVGTELIKTKTNARVILVHSDIGKTFGAGEPVVSVIDPDELRVVGSIDENKGLKDIRLGDRATFTVDAFGSKLYQGVVDEISPTAKSGDIVFSISDKRQEQQFDIKVRFDVSKYPELSNGMSAKLTVYTK